MTSDTCEDEWNNTDLMSFPSLRRNAIRLIIVAIGCVVTIVGCAAPLTHLPQPVASPAPGQGPTSSPPGDEAVAAVGHAVASRPIPSRDGTFTSGHTVEKLAVSLQILGHSTNGWPLEAYQFGNGAMRVALIGGIHGGFEWNTVLLAYQMIDYFTLHPQTVPSSISLYIVPVANPDGQVKVVGNNGRFLPGQVRENTFAGRFNGNQVDLNRNWNCNWTATAVWQNQPVSGGTEPFSEVETRILRDFLSDPPMAGVVFWHSAAPGVFASGCGDRYADSDKLSTVYANAAGYPFLLSFDSYEVTGDAGDWLALQNIPAITVELNNQADTDWEQNQKGVTALLKHIDAEEQKRLSIRE